MKMEGSETTWLQEVAPETFIKMLRYSPPFAEQYRRSALISLSNLSDDRMRTAKSGNWYDVEPQRSLANNSAVYYEKPSMEIFLKEWVALIESKSGERGVFSSYAAQKKAAENGRRNADLVVGTNPCSEIGLRSAGLCNLSEVIIRPEDTLEILLEKVEIATIIGTYQSTLSDFRYVRDIWKKNQEEERLLGVSLTGIMDHPVLNNVNDNAKYWLGQMKQKAIDVNKLWANLLGINQAAAITCVKPSGTVAQLCDTAAGIHPRFSPFYIRRVRADKKDPLAQLMRAKGYPVEDCVMSPQSTDIFSFYMSSPENSIYTEDKTAIEQLEQYLMVQEYWSEHNVSNTIYVKDDEWLEVGDWVYKNFDKLVGVSFLPFSDHVYQQAPYEEITPQQFIQLSASFPKMDWNELTLFESTDLTEGSQELACVAGQCEL